MAEPPDKISEFCIISHLFNKLLALYRQALDRHRRCSRHHSQSSPRHEIISFTLELTDMSIFSRIFKAKEVSGQEAGTDSKVSAIDAFNREIDALLSEDIFISGKDYRPIIDKYSDLYTRFDTLRQSRTLI